MTLYRYVAKSACSSALLMLFLFDEWRKYTEDYPFLHGMGKLLKTLKKLWTRTIQGSEHFLLVKRYAKKGLKKSRYPVANLRPTHADGFLPVYPDRGPFLLCSTRFATDLACKCVGEREKKKKKRLELKFSRVLSLCALLCRKV